MSLHAYIELIMVLRSWIDRSQIENDIMHSVPAFEKW